MPPHLASIAVLADDPALSCLCHWLTDPSSPVQDRTIHASGISQAALEAFPRPRETCQAPEWRVEAEAHAALISALPDCDTLITCGGPASTGIAVETSLLASLAPNAVWLQLGRIPTHIAAHFAQRAHETGVAFLHAPYRTPPADGQRPNCTAFAEGSEPELVRARTLLETVAGSVRWRGWLASSGPDRLVTEISTSPRTPLAHGGPYAA